MKNTKLWVGAIILVVIVALSIVFGRSTQTVKIGAMFPLTGGLASYGELARNMAALAVEEINSTGGINGRQLELIIDDHKCDPKQAIAVFEKQASVDDVHIFTSVACTGTVLSIASQLEAKNAVLLGTITSGNKLTGVSPNFFRNWASDRQESRLLADEIIKKGYKSVAAIYEETDYAKGLVISLQEFLKDSGVELSTESFAVNATDVRSQLTKLSALKADLLFVSVQTVTTGETVLTQMEQLKFQPNNLFVSDNILKTQTLLTDHSRLLEGAIGADYVIPVNSRLEDVMLKYKEKYGSDCLQINLCAAEYDAARLLAEAMKNTDGSTLSVRNYLKVVNYDGVSGQVSFDSNNDRANAAYSLFKISAGKAGIK